MATSKAKKKRQKLVQAGLLNPEIKRSPFALMDLSSKQTKTKKGYLYSKKCKNHQEDDSFFVVFFKFSHFLHISL
ncbi:hypothetical protein ACP0AK_07100 [Listeria ivanovii]|uniref:Uncharacterized protein n=1 Tax=Listeria ivanovii (strain ATCC BAA-678 / PAM 55) TaxID=881621 RepID=G2ZC05_LISIP|nr:hypothetical protein [Listeria ivanovii]AHI56352.1 hypothetical protein AX25_09760 [Listeria ivanovii WSLC3009]AIS65779.1 hypothetical protein JL52_09595 [Listeria ivanovii subsp. ivanovii]MBC1759190.1 hypothetical protein [Listeria ivanovii]MBK3914212.1 hypothetical protein [Listeria ivanovii subsp. ivanovii]MBK3920950.1 hypothetical protein [Listeria ivanovii subsp. ivanovii]